MITSSITPDKSLTRSIGTTFKLPLMKLKAIDAKLENYDNYFLEKVSAPTSKIPWNTFWNLYFISLKSENPYYLWKTFNSSSNNSKLSKTNLISFPISLLLPLRVVVIKSLKALNLKIHKQKTTFNVSL